jgi:hypothetical protein
MLVAIQSMKRRVAILALMRISAASPSQNVLLVLVVVRKFMMFTFL